MPSHCQVRGGDATTCVFKGERDANTLLQACMTRHAVAMAWVLLQCTA